MSTQLTGGKSMLESKTTWGILIALAAPVLDLITAHGPAIVDSVQTVAATGLLGPHGVVIGVALGSALALFGNFNRKEKITSVLPEK